MMSKKEKEAHKALDDGYNWWKDDNRKIFHEILDELIGIHDVDPPNAVVILKDLRAAMSNEYGE